MTRICLAADCYTRYEPKQFNQKFCSVQCLSREEYRRNRSKHLAQKKVYYQCNMESIKAKRSRYVRNNKDKAYSVSAAWHKANPERSRKRLLKRMILKTDTDPLDRLTENEWELLKLVWEYRCSYCKRTPKTLTQDHVVPLSKGGSHTMANVVPSCKSCNSSKGDKDLADFLFWLEEQA